MLSHIGLESKILGVEESINDIEGSLSSVEAITSKGEKIKKDIKTYFDAKFSSEKSLGEIDELTEKYKSKLSEKGVCPTCFSKISKEQLLEVEI